MNVNDASCITYVIVIHIISVHSNILAIINIRVVRIKVCGACASIELGAFPNSLTYLQEVYIYIYGIFIILIHRCIYGIF